MDTSPAEFAPPLPPATGARRLLNQAVAGLLTIAPRALRQKLGWWTWSDVLHARGSYHQTLDYKGSGGFSSTHWGPSKYRHQTPVATLLRRGFAPPSKGDIWPEVFDSLHNTWNHDNHWGMVSFHELRAWSDVWKRHPKGQECLDTALVGVVHAGRVDVCRLLLEAGANPLASPKHGGRVMDKLWCGAASFSKCLRMWEAMVQAHPKMGQESTWRSWRNGTPKRVMRLTASNMRKWKDSGVPLPTASGALVFALECVDDVDLSDHTPDMKNRQDALAWWQASGLLPPQASSSLLKTWLSTARPGFEDYYQESMRTWGQLLLPGPLPPRPGVGPLQRNSRGQLSSEGALPWSHWAMSGPFFENIPLSVLDQLFDEPDSWTARNSADENIRDVIARRIEETRSQSRDEGLDRLKMWSTRTQLERLVTARETPPAEPPSRPRL